MAKSLAGLTLVVLQIFDNFVSPPNLITPN